MIDNIYTPTVSEFMWVLDLTQMDFTLAPILVFEEIVCSSLELRIGGFDFIVPANWNILVYDSETSQLDVAELSHTAGKQFTAVVYGPTKTKPSPATVTVINYFNEHKNVTPSLNKHQMLCHAIGPDEWVCIAPSDCFNKYLKDRALGDLF
jgi:hypothetical protein